MLYVLTFLLGSLFSVIILFIVAKLKLNKDKKIANERRQEK